jgi:DNA topoisomerase-1
MGHEGLFGKGIMEKSLLIVESPTKVRTIKKYLGPGFEVKASLGHIKDLPHNLLGVDIENHFKPEFQVISGKNRVLKELKQAAKKIQHIYLAPDPDREGEAIAWHLAEELAEKGKEFHRVLFHELSARAIQEALARPERLNEQRFQSQLARRILDRLVGYQISPLLWDKVKRGLSAGRVQSVAVRIICDREREIQSFVSKEYWSITTQLQADQPPDFEARLIKGQGKAIKIGDEAQARSITERLTQATFKVVKIDKKERKRHPLPPFTTSQLQQEAFRKLRFPAKKTMFLAQRLYEGVEVGDEGLVGLITYMRTDSTRVSQEALTAVRQFIQTRFGMDYVPSKPHFYTNKKTAQDAHEAIRPTSMQLSPESIASHLEKDLLALYRLIWNRFVASQMKAAVFDQTVVDIEAGDYLLRATGSILRFPGFTTLYEVSKDAVASEEEEDEKKGQLPDLSLHQTLTVLQVLPKQHFTQPPPRYTEATLVKELEEKGIGRPSTYAAIISTIQEKEYVLKEKLFFQPTELGFLVNDLLVKNFPEILNVQFTASMENNLDMIEEGKLEWTRVLEDFYGPFARTLDQARKEMKQVRGKGVKTDIACPVCGKPMMIRIGKNGSFLACSGYPGCKQTQNFSRDEKGGIQPVVAEIPAGTEEEKPCPQCGKRMIIRNGRFGSFWACSGYPECKTTQPISPEGAPAEPEPKVVSDQVCPKCAGPMVVKKNRFGGTFLACEKYPKCKSTLPVTTEFPCPTPGCQGMLVSRVAKKKGLKFFGCSRFPECKFMIWGKPVKESCPQCQAPFLVEKTTKKEGTLWACPNKECGYQQEKGEG